MADNIIIGIKIPELDEAQEADLTNGALLVVEPEAPPTKKIKFFTFVEKIKAMLTDYPTNIEVNGLLVRESVSTGTKSFAVGYSGDCGLLISKDGYTPIGIIGFKTNNATVVMCGAYLQNAATIGYTVRNVGTSAASTSIVFHVLWAKKL